MSQRLLMFSHIPRTGGTTIRSIIRRQYPDEVQHVLVGADESVEHFLMLSTERRARVRVLTGHTPFGLHERLGSPVEYITLLREPVERVTSFYYWILNQPGNHLHESVRRMSLADFADSGIPQVTDQQTEFISGMSNSSSAEALQAAKHNLTHHFAVFGINERFDESLLLFKRRLMWRGNVCYSRQTVLEQRPRKRDLPVATIRAIEKRNCSDLELYEFALRRFEDVVNEQGRWLQKDLRDFQRMNNRARTTHRTHWFRRKISYLFGKG
jgi:hypothetical protein